MRLSPRKPGRNSPIRDHLTCPPQGVHSNLLHCMSPKMAQLGPRRMSAPCPLSNSGQHLLNLSFTAFDLGRVETTAVFRVWRALSASDLQWLLRPDCRHPRLDAHDVHHAREIVGEH